MKSTIALLLLLLLTVPARAQLKAEAEPNPHAGLTQFIEKTRDHKDGNRLLPPRAIQEAINGVNGLGGMNVGTDWKENKDRPNSGHVVAACADVINAKLDPENPKYWRIVEDWWLQRFPLEGGGLSYMLNFNTALVKQWRIFLPAVYDANGKLVREATYAKLADFTDPHGIQLVPQLSQINYVNIGGPDGLTIWGNGRVDLGQGNSQQSWFKKGSHGALPNDGLWQPAPDAVVTKPDGSKFLKVRLDGKKYGLKLEPMEW